MIKALKYFLFGVVVFVAIASGNNPAGAAPLHDAAVIGSVELVERLIANGADVDARDVRGYTPLYIAIQSGHVEVAKVLIANGADVNAGAVDDAGQYRTPLYLSIILGREAVESLLRERGAAE